MKKVLIVRVSSLGDIILTQPIIQAVAARGDRVTLLVQPGYAALAAQLPGVHEVVTVQQDKQQQYDLLLDLQVTARSRRACAGIKFKKKIHYQKHSLARRLLVRPLGRSIFWNRWSGLKNNQSVVQWYAWAARQAGYAITSQWPILNVTPAQRQSAIKLMGANKLSPEQPLAVLAPGARWVTKQWPLDRFAELAVRLSHQGFRVLVVGTAADGWQQTVLPAAKPGSISSLTGQTNLLQLAALLQMSRIVITNDSGPMHLGLAVGSKVIAMFGPTVGAFGFMPTDHPRAYVIQHNLPCRPCSLHGSNHCPLGHHECMMKINVEQVLEAVSIMG